MGLKGRWFWTAEKWAGKGQHWRGRRRCFVRRTGCRGFHVGHVAQRRLCHYLRDVVVGCQGVSLGCVRFSGECDHIGDVGAARDDRVNAMPGVVKCPSETGGVPCMRRSSRLGLLHRKSESL